jgi:hypothetical protein
VLTEIKVASIRVRPAQTKVERWTHSSGCLDLVARLRVDHRWAVLREQLGRERVGEHDGESGSEEYNREVRRPRCRSHRYSAR